MARHVIGIVGSAIAGPTLALQILTHPVLKKAYVPILFDRAKDPQTMTEADRLQTGGAAIGLFANGIYPLYQLGLNEAFDKISIETPTASFWSSTGPSFQDGKLNYIGTVDDTGWQQDIQRSLSVVERGALQSLLVSEVQRRGGEVFWGKCLQRIERLDNHRTKLAFEDTNYEVDLLVGADGAFSTVRKFVLRELDPASAQQRWMPTHCGITGMYGISSHITHIKQEVRPGAYDETHAVWLDSGFLSTSPLPNDKMRWDLLFSEPKPFEKTTTPTTEEEMTDAEGWESKIVSSQYPRDHSVNLIRQITSMPNPVTGSLNTLLASSDRIIHTPLLQKVWEENEIQHKNIVLIGDAARLMLPSSGQGTSFAIEDATVLANCLLNNPPTESSNFDQALEEYAKTRLPRSKKMAQMALYAGKLGIADAWYWRVLRYLTSWTFAFTGNSAR